MKKKKKKEKKDDDGKNSEVEKIINLDDIPLAKEVAKEKKKLRSKSEASFELVQKVYIYIFPHF